ncbi:SMP-30/gluconolactonase/LRE family protein [Phenylobacterium sp.]|jgi:gluconolactonase|uniref:SMP-30/gluconolactonase/LRE family protein n=1 Tax=Phenylobacterium sp. TaxID=1871053 RepID=UPI002E33354C|nr:SMP-30/gluconolactonase/LRE family protein [Phenylobacterium sp.]HEX3365435.1 SMP-30/gluconolactonase/LRE family protein [Phenylobacterium sp.]
MHRRTLLSAAPLLALPGFAFAQEPAAPTPPAPRPAPPPPTFPPPTLAMTTMASGLHFPEAPVVMNDGSVLFVQIEAKQVSRLKPDGTVTLVAQLDGGPNGLAVGPDKALYVANDGGRFSFNKRGAFNYPGAVPPDHIGGSIQQIDLRTGKAITLYDSCDGKRLVAPDDLVFDHHGGMWISDYGKVKGDAGIYYARADGKGIRQAKGGMNAPNGIGLSPDGKQLHVSEGRQLWTFDIKAPGELGPSTSYPNAAHANLRERSVADSLKVLADGRVCVCTLIAGGISIFDATGGTEFIQFDDPMTTNLAFGGADMRDTWVTSSGLSRIVKVRWPYPGLKPAYSA